MALEHRHYGVEDFEFRSAGDTLHFRGHASVFNRWSDPIFDFRETVRPGAFAKTLREGNIAFLYQHDPATIMARVRAGNLHLSEDTTGLLTEAQLNRRDIDVQRLEQKMSDGNITDMSFGFITEQDVKGEAEIDDGAGAERWKTRELVEVRLFDVSPVTYPAYPGTDAELNYMIPPELRAALEAGWEIRADVDNSAWDGGAAMSACADDSDPAACYGAICAGRRSGDPSLQSSWALPHHKAPGDPPNAAGVRNALARLPQTQGLTNKAAAESHLEAHMKAINPVPEGKSLTLEFDAALVSFIEETRVGKTISAETATKIAAAISQLEELLGLGDPDDEQNSAPSTLSVAAARRRLEVLAHIAA